MPSTHAHVLDPDRLGDHFDRLYRAAWARCGSRESAEDLVRDTFARVVSQRRLLRNDGELGYLLRVLRNTFFSQQRRPWNKRTFVTPDELERIADLSMPQPHAAAETQLIFEAIAALPKDFRDALVAVDVVGLPYHEAARALRIREGTVTSRLFRARRRVAEALEPAAPAARRRSPTARSRRTSCGPVPECVHI